MATSPSHRLLYNAQSGALSYDPDGNANGGAMIFAMLPLNLQASLRASHFQVT
jgi:hypothetical protein